MTYVRIATGLPRRWAQHFVSQREYTGELQSRQNHHNYELGVKGNVFNHALTFDVSPYYIDLAKNSNSEKNGFANGAEFGYNHEWRCRQESGAGGVAAGASHRRDGDFAGDFFERSVLTQIYRPHPVFTGCQVRDCPSAVALAAPSRWTRTSLTSGRRRYSSEGRSAMLGYV